jgi:RNA polymerase sigma-70 factor (ECF subfamily)
LETGSAAKGVATDIHTEIARYQAALVGVAYRITNDVECAKDIVQDTYVAALERTDGFLGLSSLKTYLYRIVINKSIDARRRRGRWQGLLDARSVEIYHAFHNNAEDVNTDAIEFVRTALDKIPETFRIPLVLAEVEGLSYEEIADALQVSLNTVRTRIYRCREKLRKELAKTGRLP